MSKHVSSYTHTQKQLDAYANQNNPNNAAYRANMANRSNQLNPNNSSYRAVQNNRANQMNPNNPNYKGR